MLCRRRFQSTHIRAAGSFSLREMSDFYSMWIVKSSITSEKRREIILTVGVSAQKCISVRLENVSLFVCLRSVCVCLSHIINSVSFCEHAIQTSSALKRFLLNFFWTHPEIGSKSALSGGNQWFCFVKRHSSRGRRRKGWKGTFHELTHQHLKHGLTHSCCVRGTVASCVRALAFVSKAPGRVIVLRWVVKNNTRRVITCSVQIERLIVEDAQCEPWDQPTTPSRPESHCLASWRANLLIGA